MKPPLTKKNLLDDLPISEDPLLIRAWTRADLDALAVWPNYPFPYEGFKFSFALMTPAERDALYDDRDGRPDALTLVLDHPNQAAIGYISLTRIVWSEGRVGNFGFRIHPDWVDKGIGTSVLGAVCTWLFGGGMSSIGVDVAASNTRAVRCYEKVGFYKVGEMWRYAQDLQDVDLTVERYDFLRPHLRQDGDVPELRFLLMALTPAEMSVKGR